jgi:hypothetical protein
VIFVQPWRDSLPKKRRRLVEYLKVVVPDRTNKDVDVLINRQKTGKVGEVLTLDKGVVLVSVDLPNAEVKQVDLCGSTPNYPKVTEIRA